MKRFYIPVLVLLALAIFLAVGLHRDPAEIPSPFIGKLAPDFSLPRLDDSNLTFSPHSMRGKVWLLNVWASWCRPCLAEFPVLQQLSQTYSVPIIGLDYTDKQQDGSQLLKQLGDPYQLSVSDENGLVAIDYGVYGVPETFVIDKQGIVRMKIAGAVTEELLKEKLLPLLEKLNHG